MLKRGVRCLLVVSLLVWSGTAWAQTKMTIATGVDPVFSAYYVAQQEGLFKKHGLDVTLPKIPQKDRHLAVASGSGLRRWT